MVDVSFKHREQTVSVGRIAFFNDHIKNQPAFPRTEIEFVSVLDVPTALDDDIGVGLKQTENLLTGRYTFTLEYTALRLIDYLLDQGQIMRRLGMPGFQLQGRTERDHDNRCGYVHAI